MERVIPTAHVEATKPHEVSRPRNRVPAAHLARIEVWLKYGMTVRQVAAVYGVSVSEMERVLQKT
jgi:hypothetical protein